MDIERLLQLYDRIADAPDAVSRLRRFVLDLAMRGKLVEQNSADEAASELLERIAAEKAASGKRHKQLPNIDYDKLTEIASNWSAAPLIALGEWAIGSGFPKSEQGQTYGAYFFLKVSDMNLPENEKYIKTANNFIDDDAAKRMRSALHPPGTIIFPKIGGAIATNKRRILTCWSAIDNNCLGLTFSPHIHTEWAYLVMSTLDFTFYQSGTALPALQQGTLAAIPVALPPLAEQHRIVAKVDQLMALCDGLDATHNTREATRDRLTTASFSRLLAPDTDKQTFQSHALFALDTLPALTSRPDQIKTLRHTILNLAVRGRLVEQDADDEAVDVLDAENLETGESLPSRWRYVRLKNLLSEKNRNGYSRRPDDAKNGVPILRISAGTVRQDGIVAEEGHKLISGIDDRTKAQYRLDPGDPLACRFNGNKAFVGRLTLFSDYLHLKPLYPDKLIRVRLNKRLAKPEFIRMIGDSDVVRRQVEKFCATTVGNWGISASNLNEVLLPLPPVAEQCRIVAKVSELMILCEQLEVSLTGANAKRAWLLKSLVAEALAHARENLEAA